jgi:hypothetical protein
MGLRARRSTIALDLWQYGEESAAESVFRLSIQDFQRVCDRAYELASDIPEGASHGMMLAKACALAAVEVLDGASRPLARGRRRVVPLPEELQLLAAEERRHYENLTPGAQERRWPGSL